MRAVSARAELLVFFSRNQHYTRSSSVVNFARPPVCSFEYHTVTNQADIALNLF